ncbi:MAG: ROK family protein [Muribaculaceae bacterium]|nr:ROK family protein [Muribaculaceae bacterium]
MAVIAIDIGGTKIAGAVMSATGNLLFTHRNLIKGRTGEDVGKLILHNISHLISRAKSHDIKIESIGICVPGNADPITGRVYAPNIPGWKNFPLKNMIRSFLNYEPIDIFIDNDRICYVYGEMWKGVAQNCQNVIFIAVGTGIGAGIIIDGHALYGACNIIGATGWMAMDAPHREEYTSTGCFEYYASGVGICNRTQETVRKEKSYRGKLRQMPITRITTNDVFDGYAENDPISIAIINRAVQMWGMGSANLVSILNPEMIIWGGGVFGPAKELIKDIYEEAKKWAQPINIKRCQFVASELSGRAGLLGAGYIALNKIVPRK